LSTSWPGRGEFGRVAAKFLNEKIFVRRAKIIPSGAKESFEF